MASGDLPVSVGQPSVVAPDEPTFTLRARDPLAPFLVSIWSSLRLGDHEAARVKFDAMLDRVAVALCDVDDVDAAAGFAAMDCFMAMFAWAEARRTAGPGGDDREPHNG